MTDALPEGFHTRTFRAAEQGSSTNRGGTVITGPDGTRVTFYAEGGLRVFRPDHELVTRDQTHHRDGNGDSVYVDFKPSMKETSRT